MGRSVSPASKSAGIMPEPTNLRRRMISISPKALHTLTQAGSRGRKDASSKAKKHPGTCSESTNFSTSPPGGLRRSAFRPELAYHSTDSKIYDHLHHLRIGNKILAYAWQADASGVLVRFQDVRGEEAQGHSRVPVEGRLLGGGSAVQCESLQDASQHGLEHVFTIPCRHEDL
eukprot:scaffold7559_cov248-Pinguiococcus_pyrenoidosus.AAC.2